jgi:hypothetical protein
MTMPRVVNILLGLSAAGSFREAITPTRGELIANDDALSCGPLTALRSIEDWSALRQGFWNSIVSDTQSRSVERTLTENAAALRDAESIVVWLGLSADEQLHLAWFAQFRKLIGCNAPMNIVQFLHLRDGTNAWGLGLLSAEEFQEHPWIDQLSDADVAELERYWPSVASSDPTALLAFLSDTSSRFPRFRPAVRRLLDRYPHPHSGLGRWDFELLKRTQQHGPRPPVARVIGDAIGNNLDADLVGDAYLLSRVRRLAATQLAHPLLTLSGEGEHMWSGEVDLTPAGEDVLAGRANAVELNGIDDWVLGVHLDSKAGAVRYHENGTLIEG